MIALFDWVLVNAKESRDDKVPISIRLLIELCDAAEKVLVGYNQVLAKVVLLSPWGAYMRVLEYSKTKSKQDHNLCHDSVQICDDGLCVEFLSNKTMKKSEPPHHRLITWSDLPEGSMETFLQYKQLRPKKAPYFFTRKDGRLLEQMHVMAFFGLVLNPNIIPDVTDRSSQFPSRRSQ